MTYCTKRKTIKFVFILKLFCLLTCRHLNSQLIELEKAIERMMESDFVHFAIEDVQNRIKNSSNEVAGSEKAETEVTF